MAPATGEPEEPRVPDGPRPLLRPARHGNVSTLPPAPGHEQPGTGATGDDGTTTHGGDPRRHGRTGPRPPRPASRRCPPQVHGGSGSKRPADPRPAQST